MPPDIAGHHRHGQPIPSGAGERANTRLAVLWINIICEPTTGILVINFQKKPLFEYVHFTLRQFVALWYSLHAPTMPSHPVDGKRGEERT